MSTMTRVTKSNPCPICKKGDWCLMGKQIAICMRVISIKSKVFADGSVGYLHSMDSSIPVNSPKPKPVVKAINCEELLKGWRSRLKDQGLGEHAASLGVTEQSLVALGCQPAPYFKAYAYPMRDGKNHIVGIRLRNEAGKKWAVTGSHQGLFIPQANMDGYLYIVEGPTDTAAALSIGARAIGRPSCMGGVFDLIEYIKRNNIKRAVVIADNDQDRIRDGVVMNPGTDGADRLAQQLGIYNCTLLLPKKDMREFVRSGGTGRTLDYLTSQCVWRKP